MSKTEQVISHFRTYMNQYEFEESFFTDTIDELRAICEKVAIDEVASPVAAAPTPIKLKAKAKVTPVAATPATETVVEDSTVEESVAPAKASKAKKSGGKKKPSPYNLFVTEQYKDEEIKALPYKERMKAIAQRWAVTKENASELKHWQDLANDVTVDV